MKGLVTVENVESCRNLLDTTGIVQHNSVQNDKFFLLQSKIRFVQTQD